MKKEIKALIQKAQVKAEFGLELVPRRRGKGKARIEGYTKKTPRDFEGNPVDKSGNLILTRLRVEHTMTPKQQYLQSARNPYRKEI